MHREEATDEGTHRRRRKHRSHEQTQEQTISEEINPYTNKPYSQKYYQIFETRTKLPVYERKEEIIEAVKNNRVTIIEGSTGSGKTTQIPRFLFEAGLCDPSKKIVCTQPRRVAAINVAARVAEEMDIQLGREIGYCVRFDVCESDITRLTYMTDGLLMREFVIDPDVNKFGIVIIDEAHERTINSDIIIGLLKKLIQKREDLKVVIMSATLEAAKFQAFFDDVPEGSEKLNTPHIMVPGRLHKVTKIYTETPVRNYIDEAVARVLNIHFEQPEGDILLFMTGEEEIETTCDRLRREIRAIEHPQGMDAYVLPLYASLPPMEQAKVFKPAKYPNTRKIIVSTNIAETSLTIDGVVYVIDPGFVKQNSYNPERRMSALLVVNISRAAAVQRAGRAGRTRRGICYRLYTKESFEKELAEQTTPEIQRSDLCNVLLLMLAAGIDDIVHFPFIDPPEYKLVKTSIEELYFLGAIGIDGKLTERGRLMSLIPIEPKLAAALIASADFGCSREIATLVAMMSEQGNALMRPPREAADADLAHKQFRCSFSDHITLVRTFNAYEANPTKAYCHENYLNFRMLDRAYKSRQQLLSLMQRHGIPIRSIYAEDIGNADPDKVIVRALLQGMFMQLCMLNTMTGHYLFMTNQNEADIHPSSAISTKPAWVMYSEYIYTNADYIRTVSAVDRRWVVEAQPEFFDPSRFPNGTLKHELLSLNEEFGKK